MDASDKKYMKTIGGIIHRREMIRMNARQQKKIDNIRDILVKMTDLDGEYFDWEEFQALLTELKKIDANASDRTERIAEQKENLELAIERLETVKTNKCEDLDASEFYDPLYKASMYNPQFYGI